jgi:hypothetical protein
MSRNLIYIDDCSMDQANQIKKTLNVDVVLRLPNDKWNINDAMSIIMTPSINLAIINSIDEIAVMEMTLLHFMCKPILVTTKTIKNYKTLERTVVDYIEPSCNLNNLNNTFFSWYLNIFRRNNG